MEKTSSSALPRHVAQYALLMISERQTSTLVPEDESRPPDAEPRRSRLNCDAPKRPQLLTRCKRSRTNLPGADFVFPHRQQFVASVDRRNERERNRVRLVNAGFQTLRRHVPNGAPDGKLSKVETLRSAVEYIRALQRLLRDNQADSAAAAFQSDGVPSPSPTVSSALSLGRDSPHSTCSSPEDGAMSSEDPELLDFTAWLHRY